MTQRFPNIESVRKTSDEQVGLVVKHISDIILDAATKGDRGVRINFTELGQRAISSEMLVDMLKAEKYSAWAECPYRDTYICITW